MMCEPHGSQKEQVKWLNYNQTDTQLATGWLNSKNLRSTNLSNNDLQSSN